MTVQAATIVVNTSADVIDEDGLCSLREAIINANHASQHGSTDCVAGEAGGNTIVFDAALAGETITLNGEHLLITTRNLTIEGPVPGDRSGLILDGGQASRVINVLGPGMHVAVNLRDMTVTGGRTEDISQPGGGLHAQSVVLTLDNVAVVENSTGGNSSGGGGISGLQAKIELIDSLVENNHVEGLGTTGGGIFVRGGELELTRTHVIGNRTEGGGNSNGGGIWAGWFGAVGSDLSLTDSVVSGNATETGTAFGGGIWAAGGEVVITGSTISGNSIANGGAGGISVDETQFILVNSTVSGNSCTSSGGGLQIRRSDASLIHSTVAFNVVSGSGIRGIWLFGTETDPTSLELVNSLVVQENASEPTCFGSEFSPISSTGSLSTHDSCTGVASAPEDIKLLGLAENGGLARTHALGAGSLAIGFAGDCSGELSIDADQRGEPRPGGSSDACDAGAYEFQGINEDLIFRDRFEN